MGNGIQHHSKWFENSLDIISRLATTNIYDNVTKVFDGQINWFIMDKLSCLETRFATQFSAQFPNAEYMGFASFWAWLINLTLQWRHNGRDGVSNHPPHDCLLNRLFWRRSKKTSKLRVTGLCAGNSPGTGEFPAQMASYAENVPIWWRHHE